MSTSDPDLELVVAQERRLLDPACRASTDCLLELLHPDFREHGTSGRVWSLPEVLVELPADPSFDGSALDFEATRLAPDVILLTFRTVTTERTSLRSSLWLRGADGRWRMRFHQGTPTR